MKTHLTLFLSLIVWASAATAWSQDVPPPPPAPPPPVYAPGSPPPPPSYAPGSGGPVASPAYPPGSYSPPPDAYSPPPDAYSPPPGAVIVAPGEPYPYPYAYPPPGPYHRHPMVLVPAPPMQSYSWDVKLDALFLERSSGGSVYLGSIIPTSNSIYPNVPTGNIYSDDAPFSLAPGMRLEVSRTFDNDITLSGTYWGFQQWSVNETMNGDPYGQTAVGSSPYLQVPVFDTSLGYTYSSEIQNVEFNALFRLSASDSYWQLNWLLGARYVYFTDHLALVGVDTYNSGATETLDYQTTNNLVGVQTGLLFVHGWERFQWEAGLKCGLMANMYRQHGSDTVSDPAPAGFTPFDVANSGCDVAGLFEFTLAARIRLSDTLTLRLGYQIYDITSLALAPRQLSNFDNSGNVAFDGLSIGLQATW